MVEGSFRANEFGKMDCNKVESVEEQGIFLGPGKNYSNQVVVQSNNNTIMWRDGIYERKGTLMDVELIIDIYENGAKANESKIRKMKAAIWILGVALVIMVNILLSLLI